MECQPPTTTTKMRRILLVSFAIAGAMLYLPPSQAWKGGAFWSKALHLLAGDPNSGIGIMLPTAIATDTSGNVYVTDMFMQTVQKITPAGVITTLAGSFLESGSTDGTHRE